METTSILIWGMIGLAAVIILGLLFSKRNPDKKVDEVESPIEEDDLEEADSEEDEDLDRLDDDEEDDDDDEEDEDDDEYDDTVDADYDIPYSGGSFNLSGLVIGFVVMMIVIMVGMNMLSEVGDAMESMSTTSSMNSTYGAVDAMANSIGIAGVLPSFFIIWIILLPIAMLMFRPFFRGDGLV